ncbi:MAG: hypothetical protein CMG09_05010 [Candidatus Marinimicrobia bacterium]|nr:hypothetical protein [Candidatus Neomarinimicrobiota bacterium]
MKKNLLILLLGICYCNIDLYDIKWMGVKVAECSAEVSDTLINENFFIKLDYKVKSNLFMKLLFNVTNHYTTIIDPTNYNIIFYSKNTTQPNLSNQILKTDYIDQKVTYPGTNYIINENEKNIFSLLYLLSAKKISDYDNIILDREGKKYKCQISIKNEEYILNISEKAKENTGFYENTDIFSWALFLPNTDKKLKINKNKIEYCKFKKGLISFTANRVK